MNEAIEIHFLRLINNKFLKKLLLIRNMFFFFFFFFSIYIKIYLKYHNKFDIIKVLVSFINLQI